VIDLSQQFIHTESYFDGSSYHNEGPYMVTVSDGVIAAVSPCSSADLPDDHAKFLMPGLVEAHCHLFLDGGELDLKKRSEYLKAPFDEMIDVAHQNVAANLAAGVTLIRDAGDKYGVNHQVRREAEESNDVTPGIRSPGLGVRKPKRYGGFMAREVESREEIKSAVEELLETGDELKILLTGIIDFESGSVKGTPQFDVEETKFIVETAHALGRRTFAHCSGLLGLEVAAEAGVDSVEHGFFMTRDILEILAEKQIAWVPTFSPVHDQWAHPEVVGWSDETIGHLRNILDSHLEHVAMAADMGVPLVIGSDAGSLGVVHGKAVIDEIFFFMEAGLKLEVALNAATTLPRRLWSYNSADIAPNNKAEFIALTGSPFDDPEYLRKVAAIFKDDTLLKIG